MVAAEISLRQNRRKIMVAAEISLRQNRRKIMVAAEISLRQSGTLPAYNTQSTGYQMLRFAATVDHEPD